MIRKPAVGLLVLTLVATFTLTFLSIGWYRGGSKYMVTVTNITRGQIVSPVVVASHSYIQDHLFTLGEPGSDVLTMVAEDAATDDLIGALESNLKVRDIQVIKPEPRDQLCRGNLLHWLLNPMPLSAM